MGLGISPRSVEAAGNHHAGPPPEGAAIAAGPIQCQNMLVCLGWFWISAAPLNLWSVAHRLKEVEVESATRGGAHSAWGALQTTVVACCSGAPSCGPPVAASSMLLKPWRCDGCVNSPTPPERSRRSGWLTIASARSCLAGAPAAQRRRCFGEALRLRGAHDLAAPSPPLVPLSAPAGALVVAKLAGPTVRRRWARAPSSHQLAVCGWVRRRPMDGRCRPRSRALRSP